MNQHPYSILIVTQSPPQSPVTRNLLLTAYPETTRIFDPPAVSAEGIPLEEDPLP